MEPISQNKDNNFSTWEALNNDYLNEEKKNHRATKEYLWNYGSR